MQIKMNNINNNKSQLGSILPKDIGKTTVICSDLILKKQVEELLDIMNQKLKPNIELIDSTDLQYIEKYRDWTNKDYQDFRREIARFTIPLFKNIYPNLLYYLNFSKTELETELKYIDDLLDLNIFLDERVFKNNTEIVDEADTKKEITYVPHVFSITDLPKFFKALSSKVDSYKSRVLKMYNERFDINKTIKEQIDELKLLIEMFDEDNQEIISLVKEPYFDWINKLSKEHPLYLYLESMLSTVLRDNRLCLEYKLADLEQKKKSIHRFYLMGRKNDYFSKQSKKKKEL